VMRLYMNKNSNDMHNISLIILRIATNPTL
jgi:hypothetical protein